MNKLPEAAYVRACLDYDPDTGIFTWRERPREHFPDERIWHTINARCASKVAGSRCYGGIYKERDYWAVGLAQARYPAHRLAWLLVYGADPWPLEIDHIDGDGLNNRIANLRLATRGQQLANARLRKDNRLGIKGITRFRGGYQASIRANRKIHHLGTFPTIEEATEARRKAAIEFHGEYARHE
jgi:hypothetical protein